MTIDSDDNGAVTISGDFEELGALVETLQEAIAEGVGSGALLGENEVVQLTVVRTET